MTYTTQKNEDQYNTYSDFEKGKSLLKHYKKPSIFLMKMFKSDAFKGESYIHYFYYKNETDEKPQYKKLFCNFNLIQRWKLARSYKKLLKKSLIDNSGGTFADKYMDRNKQLFRESRLSNLLD